MTVRWWCIVVPLSPLKSTRRVFCAYVNRLYSRRVPDRNEEQPVCPVGPGPRWPAPDMPNMKKKRDPEEWVAPHDEPGEFGQRAAAINSFLRAAIWSPST